MSITDTKRGTIDNIDLSYPGLKELLQSTMVLKDTSGLPPPLQLKSKTSDMLYSVIAASPKLAEHGLIVPITTAMDTMGTGAVRELYHGFLVDNEADRLASFKAAPENAVKVQGGWLPVEKALVLFAMLVAFKDDPTQLGTRVYLSQIRRWVIDHLTHLANALYRRLY